MIFHRPRFPWNKGSHFPSKTLPFGVRDPCEVAIIWPFNVELTPNTLPFMTSWLHPVEQKKDCSYNHSRPLWLKLSWTIHLGLFDTHPQPTCSRLDSQHTPTPPLKKTSAWVHKKKKNIFPTIQFKCSEHHLLSCSVFGSFLENLHLHVPSWPGTWSTWYHQNKGTRCHRSPIQIQNLWGL